MYIPTTVTTIWTLLDSTVQINKLAELAELYKLPAVCLTDDHNLKGVVSFVNQMEKHDIVPIIGCRLNIENKLTKKINHITVLAKNKCGYKNIIKLVSLGNTHENFKEDQPTIKMADLVHHKNGLIVLMGEMTSPLAYALFKDPFQDKILSNQNGLKQAEKIVEFCSNTFDHFFLLKNIDESLDVYRHLNETILQLSKKFSVEWLPNNYVHYLKLEDRDLHESIIKSSVESIRKATEKASDFPQFKIFYTDNPICYLPPSIPDGQKTLKLLDIIKPYSIREKPILPQFKLNKEIVSDPDELLKSECRKGFEKLGINKSSLKKVYINRVNEELQTFAEIGLSSYFLIVQDVINFCKQSDVPADVRGSSTGCLINYLLGISSVDPICPDPLLEYSPVRELPLSRFYNKGRNTGDHISMPDIDIDVPPHFRSVLVSFLKKKYGDDCVAHICTHSRFKGKGAIKEVFRLSGLPFEIANNITKIMVDEAKISDELSEIQEEDPSYGIIQWNIDNVDEIREQAELYPTQFETAIAMEKIPKNLSVHAAGFIVSPEPLGNLFPMVYWDKSGEQVLGIEGSDIEELGGFKLDILGVHMLSKVMSIQEMINESLDSPAVKE